VEYLGRALSGLVTTPRLSRRNCKPSGPARLSPSSGARRRRAIKSRTDRDALTATMQRIEKRPGNPRKPGRANYIESHSGCINRKCISAVELKQEPAWLRGRQKCEGTRRRGRGAIYYLPMPLSAIIWLASLTVRKRA
jgi:hypothetical protein